MKTIFAAACLLVFFISCQKEISYDVVPPSKEDSTPVKVDTPPVKPDTTPVKVDTTPVKVDTASFLVKTSYEKRGNVVQEYVYTYDAKGRITSKVSPSGISKSVYTYNANNTFTVEWFENNNLTAREINFINSLGFVDSVVHYSKDTTAVKLIYDANKIPVTQKEYRVTGSKSNLTNTITTEHNAVSNTTREYDAYGSQIVYDYYTNYPNTLNVGLIYYPRSPYLEKTSVHTNSTTSKTWNYTYTFDAQKRITGVTIADGNGVNVTTRKYTY